RSRFANAHRSRTDAVFVFVAADCADAWKALMRIAPPRTVARKDARAEPTRRCSRRSSEGRCEAGPHAVSRRTRQLSAEVEDRGTEAAPTGRRRVAAGQPLLPKMKSRGAEAAPTEEAAESRLESRSCGAAVVVSGGFRGRRCRRRRRPRA